MNLLNENSFFNRFFGLLGDIILANLMFVFCSIPLITIGPAFTALYHCLLRTVKGNSSGTIKTYLRAFKENFLQSLAVWLGFLAVSAVLALNIRFLHQTDSFGSRILLYASYCLLVLLIILVLYIFPVIAAFKNSIKQHIKNVFLFAFMHFPSTIAIAFISIFPMYTTYRDLTYLPIYACCWFFFGFGLMAYINSYLFYRMFKPYLSEPASAD